MKMCNTCKIEKPLREFYGHFKMKDGRLGKCKGCCKKAAKERYEFLCATDPQWLLKELKRQRIKSAKARANGTASPTNPLASKLWRQRNPEKYKAHCALNNAIRDGKIQREKCWCGKKAQAHHDNYSKPLDVKWLCAKHHFEEHVKEHEKILLSK